MTNARDVMGELAALDEEVKRLVKTERRLHDAQRVIEVQLDRFKALSDLALRVGRADGPEAILDAALGTLLEVLLVDQAAAFVALCTRELAPAAFKAQPGLAPPAGRQWTAKLVAPRMRSVVFSPSRGEPALDEDVRRCFDSVATHFAGDRTDPDPAAVEIALPLRCRGVIPACEAACATGDSALLALVILRKTAKPSFHEHSVGEDDLPFLELVAGHTETALENALLCRELSAAAAQLERRVTERTAELARANHELAHHQSELAEAVAFREQVLAIVGHDLRNPLGAIRFSAGMALRRDAVSHELSQETRRALARIDAAAMRMVEMIGTLLDFAQSRFRAGLPISPEAMSLEDVVRRVVDELHATNPGRPIELDLDGNGRGLWDPARIAQVVSNLVGNALTHGAPDEPVRVSVKSADDAVVLEVRNRGPTIPPELMPVLFEPFRRGRTSARTSRLGGLGLGLYIAHQIVVAHGGTITARSTADEGTLFAVRLPRGERARER